MTYTEDGGCRLFRNLGVIIQTTAIQVLTIENLKTFYSFTCHMDVKFGLTLWKDL